jgi:hypothetical protein
MRVQWHPGSQTINLDYTDIPAYAKIYQISVMNNLNNLLFKIHVSTDATWQIPPNPASTAYDWSSDGVATFPLPCYLTSPITTTNTPRYLVAPSFVDANGAKVPFTCTLQNQVANAGGISGLTEYTFGFTANDGTQSSITIQVQTAGGGHPHKGAN